MFSMISVLPWVIAAPLSLALTVFILETCFGLMASKLIKVEGDQPKTVVLMPAHDEASNISATLEQLEPVLSDRVRLLVVADNCSDQTAEIVKVHGYEVIERSDIDHRGKGYALAFGRDHLRQNPPDCVVVLDADCTTDQQSIRDLSRYCLELSLPVQAQYVLNPDKNASPMVQISNFAFWVKNVVRQRGGQRIGAAALLTGTGMSFPWSLFGELPLATSDIVEDLGLTIYLTQTGNAPIYLDQALIRSLAAGEQATLTQRTRWEHGFLSMARAFGVTSFFQGIRRADHKLFQIGLHLMVPPVALLLGVSIIGLGLTALTAALFGSALPFFFIAAPLVLAIIAIFLAWCSGGKRWVSGGTLFKLPIYLLWKIPIYLGLFRGPTSSWDRTER